MNLPFILFGGNDKPKGGFLDYISSWGSADEAEAEALRLGLAWWQVAVFQTDGNVAIVKQDQRLKERPSSSSSPQKI